MIKLKELLDSNPFEDWDKSEDGRFVYGWRAGGVSTRNHEQGGNTEGDGVYISQNEDLASGFGDAKKLKFKVKKTLVVDEEPLYLLQEIDPLGHPVWPDGSKINTDYLNTVWHKINKISVHQAEKKFPKDWEKAKNLAGTLLTRYVKRLGYDSILITSGGESWVVLLDPNVEPVDEYD